MPLIHVPEGEIHWEEYGNPSGKPVFFFHGWPGSQRQASLAHPSALELGLRLIAPDRPGMGGSNFAEARKITDWPTTLLRLADHLGLREFSIFAVSGGGPYALACANCIPDRLTKVGICAGVPYSNWIRTDSSASALLRYAIRFHDLLPILDPPIFSLLRSYMLHMSSVHSMKLIVSGMSEPDRSFLMQSEMLENFWSSTRESFRQSGKGVAHEIKLLTSNWGFQPWDVHFPIQWWHGAKDEICPVSAIQLVASRNESIRLQVYPTEGHYSLPLGRIRELLSYFAVEN